MNFLKTKFKQAVIILLFQPCSGATLVPQRGYLEPFKK